MPQDDPTWPSCRNASHLNTTGALLRHWCDSTRDFLLESKDAEDIVPGLRYCVPVVPMMDFYAEVSIAQESYAGGKAAMMALVRDSGASPDPFGLTSTEEFLSLGMWTKGEGRFVMSNAIWDWVASNEPDKCTQNSHSFPEEMTLQATLKQTDTEAPRANRWIMAFYNKCIVCFGKDPGGVALPNLDPAAYGLGPNNFKPDPGASGSGGAVTGQLNITGSGQPFQSQADRTKALLNARFK